MNTPEKLVWIQAVCSDVPEPHDVDQWDAYGMGLQFCVWQQKVDYGWDAKRNMHVAFDVWRAMTGTFIDNRHFNFEGAKRACEEFYNEVTLRFMREQL